MENRFQINFPLSYYYYYFRSVPIKEYDSFVWKEREGGSHERWEFSPRYRYRINEGETHLARN